MAFKLREDFYNVSTRRGLLNNSLTVKVGDVICPLSSTDNIYTNDTAVIAATTTTKVLGVVVGFSKVNGEVIGQGQDPATTPAQLITASDNTTVAKYYAVYLPIYSHMIWSATLDAKAGTTSHSDAELATFPLATAALLDESSVLVVLSGPQQFISFGLDLVDDPSTQVTIIGKFQNALLEL